MYSVEKYRMFGENISSLFALDASRWMEQDNTNAIGIDALSPHTDSVIEKKQEFKQCSPIGEKPIARAFSSSPKTQYFPPGLTNFEAMFSPWSQKVLFSPRNQDVISNDLAGIQNDESPKRTNSSDYEDFVDTESDHDLSEDFDLELESTSPPDPSNTIEVSFQHDVVFSPPHGEHPLGEHPSRTLFVRNINSNVEDEELRVLFEAFGSIRSMYTQCKHRGFVMISYYDIRHAKTAMRHLQGKVIRRRKIDIHYSIPKFNPSEKDQNQGTLVVFNLDPSITNEELKNIFGTFGEIKEIRETPNKKHHKFIEFYDVRDAEKAMKNLNKTEIKVFWFCFVVSPSQFLTFKKAKKIKIEPSRPGGARKTLMRQLAYELSEQEQHPPLSLSPTHSLDKSSFMGMSPVYGQQISSKQQNSPLEGFSPRDFPSPRKDFSPAYGSPPSSSSSPVHGALFPRALSNSSISVSWPNHVPAGKLVDSSPEIKSLSDKHSVTTLMSTLDLSSTSAPASSSFESANRAAQALHSHSHSPRGLSKSMEQEHPLRASRHRSDSSLEDKSQYILELEKIRDCSKTTLMIKNIPNKYSQKMLLAAVDEHHKGSYDFFYLPIDFKNKCNVGYAFINFISPESIVSFYREFNNKKWEKFNSEKVCAISYARIQGKHSLIAHFQNSSLMCEDKKCRPIIFHSDGPNLGEQEPFPVGPNVRPRRSSSKDDSGGLRVREGKKGKDEKAKNLMSSSV